MITPTPENKTRKPCRYCGCPEANAEDWANIEPGKGEELGLCWDGEVCRHDAEAAIDRLLDERNTAREDAERLATQLQYLTECVENLVGESHGVSGLHLNGDVAPWGEISSGGRFERLPDFADIHQALAAHEALSANTQTTKDHKTA